MAVTWRLKKKIVTQPTLLAQIDQIRVQIYPRLLIPRSILLCITINQSIGNMSGVVSWLAKTAVNAVVGSGHVSSASGGGSAGDAATGTVVPIAGKRVRILKQLGEGGYAFVYSVEDVDSPGQLYALKRLICQDEQAVKVAEKEIRLMKRFNDPNIVQFYGACRKDLAKSVLHFTSRYHSAPLIHELMIWGCVVLCCVVVCRVVLIAEVGRNFSY